MEKPSNLRISPSGSVFGSVFPRDWDSALDNDSNQPERSAERQARRDGESGQYEYGGAGPISVAVGKLKASSFNHYNGGDANEIAQITAPTR